MATVIYADVERIENTTALLPANLKTNQLGIETDLAERIVYKDVDGNLHYYSNISHNHHTLTNSDASIDPVLSAADDGQISISVISAGDTDDKILVSDGGVIKQIDVSALPTTAGAGGNDTELQFNNGDVLSGTSNVTYEDGKLKIGGPGDIGISSTGAQLTIKEDNTGGQDAIMAFKSSNSSSIYHIGYNNVGGNFTIYDAYNSQILATFSRPGTGEAEFNVGNGRLKISSTLTSATINAGYGDLLITGSSDVLIDRPTKIGDANSTNFDIDGHQTMSGDAKVYDTVTMGFNYNRITGAGKPTQVSRGNFNGFSLPTYSTDEELFACQCMSTKWDGVTNPEIFIGGWLPSANTAKKFNMQISVETTDYVGNEVIPTTTNDYPVETTTDTWAAYTSFFVGVTIDASAIGLAVGQPLAIRIRRLDASADEITGEVVVEGCILKYARNKIGDQFIVA